MTLESKTIHEKLFIIQQEIGAITKGSVNPYYTEQRQKAGGKGDVKYFDINALIDHLLPMLKQHNLLLLQPLVTNDFEQNGVETQLIEYKTGSMVKSFCRLPEINDPQKMGSAITYFRRYTLQSLLGLQAEDDDAALASGKVKQKADWQITKIDALIHTCTLDESTKTNIEAELNDMDFARANKCIDYLLDNQKKSLTEEMDNKLNN